MEPTRGQPPRSNRVRLTKNRLLARGETTPWLWLLPLFGALLCLVLVMIATAASHSARSGKGGIGLLGGLLAAVIFTLISISGRHLGRWRLGRAVRRDKFYITEDKLVYAEKQPTRNLPYYILEFRRGDTGKLERYYVTKERFESVSPGEAYFCIRQGKKLLGEYSAQAYELDEELAGYLRSFAQEPEGKEEK